MRQNTNSTPLENLPRVVNNSSLFTDYYLAELLRDDPFFQKSKGEAKQAWKAIKTQYEKVKGLLPMANEAETEHRFIRPVLDIIGYKDLYSLQPPVPSPEGIRRPDFAFFASKDELEEAEKHLKGKPEYFAKAVAVGDAKQWERSLDKKIKGSKDPFTNQNPTYQIDFYLRVTDKTWGILANGRHWRLYHRDTSYRMDAFYEIDLPAMLREYDDSFLYFYAFFCKEALTSSFLDRAYKESQEYVAKLGDELKENVYEALRLLAEGFLKFPGNDLSEDDSEEIRANTFVLIYRLLFLFYAEDRGLLPLENPNYRSYSLRELARETAERLDHGHALSPATRGYWAKLSDLFRIVNKGDDLLGVPPYNGGLFDPAKHPFLEQHKVGDLYLAKATDRLARAEASGRTGRGPVSYRDLEIRHIGAIYEGLLEHHLRVADQETAVIKEKGREKFITIAELNGRKALRTYQTGEVYLETDKGERKATGSYYTPHYIVQYIVRNTLEPLIEEKRKEIQRTKQELGKKVKQSRGYNRETYEKQLHKIGNRLIDAILSIKVLDPAMGSGHFLVEATDFLARELIRALGESPEEVEEDESRWARREVVERCIFGVDLNPLAVELAKLSLWLYTVAKDRPLSFLDHHLCLGNSLIGAWMRDLGALPVLKKRKKAEGSGQISFFESELKKKLPIVIGQVVKLLQTPSDKVEQIRKKERIYNKILEILCPFKEVANVWTSAYFGNEIEAGDYEHKLLLKLSDQPAAWESEVRSQPWFAKTQAIAEEKHFFHWELAFPEVFYRKTGQRKENPGFDTVIGNPPYLFLSGKGSPVKQLEREGKYHKAEALKREINYLSERFIQSSKGCKDYYKWFIEQVVNLTRPYGRASLIASNTWIAYPKFRDIRNILAIRNCLLELIDIGGEVFPDPTVLASIFTVQVMKNGEAPSNIKYVDLKHHPRNELKRGHFSEIVQTHMSTITIDRATVEFEIYHSPVALRLMAKLPNVFSIAPFVIREGEHDLNIDKERLRVHPSINDVPIVQDWEMGRYVSPSIAFLPKLSAGVSISDLHRGERLLLRKTGDTIVTAPPVDYHDGVAHQNVYVLQVIDPDIKTGYICSLLNSHLLTHVYQHTPFGQAGRVQAQFRIDFLYRLPIRCIAFTTPKEEREQLVKEGKQLYQNFLKTKDPAPILDLVERCLPKDDEGNFIREEEKSDVVHDLLAFLAERMIELNKECQKKMKAFLQWLETELEITPDAKGREGIEALTGKTKLKDYLGDYQKGKEALSFDEIWSILRKNKSRIGRNLTPTFMQEVQTAYDESLSKLLPIKEQLRVTDAIIDQIVYRLYGLAEEEIEVVEGDTTQRSDNA